MDQQNPNQHRRLPPHARSLIRAAGFLGIILLALLPRAAFLADWELNFDADEALVGLQARDILAGRLPVFLPGQSYMGSLQSALAAPLIALLGHHANAVRLAPMLWLVPGFLGLAYLERLGRSSPNANHSQWFLAVQWFLPPAVLFLAGVKARGGNLESLVIGFWAVALLWPRRDPAVTRDALLRASAAGALFGLGYWTHDQTLLLGPLLGVLLLLDRNRLLWRPLAFLGGCVLGYVPLWLPRLVRFAVGPPGLAGTDWKPAWPDSIWSKVIAPLPDVFAAPLLAGGEPTGLARIAAVTLLVLTLGCCIGALGGALRHVRNPSSASPGVLTTFWLALASAGALLLWPPALDDSQWFRYTLCIAPFLLVSRSWVLSRVPALIGWGVTVLFVVLTLASYQWAVPCWPTPHSESRRALAAHLEKQGIHNIATTWKLGYFIRFISEDRILASCTSAARYPDVTARVRLSDAPWRVYPIPEARIAAARSAGIEPGVEDLFSIARRGFPPPKAFAATFQALDLRRTLLPHFEPFPLLRAGTWPQDWRGWPYQRPLSRFEAIVWLPRYAPEAPVESSLIEIALDRVLQTGEFRLAAEWDGNRILIRVN